MFFSADVESDVVQPSKKKGQGKKDGRFSGFLMVVFRGSLCMSPIFSVIFHKKEAWNIYYGKHKVTKF